MDIINNKILGDKNKNLVFETAGHIYVKVNDQFYELNFRDDNKNKSEIKPEIKEENNKNNTVEQQNSNNDFVTKKYLNASLVDYVTKKSWNDLKETQVLLENAKLDGFTESINPIAVNTMQLIVGSEQLQFDFIQDFVTDVQVPNVLKIEDDKLICPEAYIKHYTIDGPNAVSPEKGVKEYCRWHLIGTNQSETPDLNTYFQLSGDIPYYLYIKVEQLTGWENRLNNLQEDGKTPVENPDDEKSKTGIFAKTGNGSYVISEYPISMLEEPGYYYLLYAIINTSEGSNNRSISTLNGFTEILPGQITANLFKTSDGTSFLDLKNNIFKLGSSDPNKPSLSFNEGNNGELVLKGTLIQKGTEPPEPIGYFRGDYNINIEYSKGDEVVYTNSDNETSTYRYISDIVSKGNLPTDTTYWKVIAKGSNGEGAATVYRGEFDASKLYYGNKYRLDCVCVTQPDKSKRYYIAKTTAGDIPAGNTPPNEQYWRDFGAQFESVATDLLLAENANIGGFIFKKNKLMSQINGSDGNPNLELDGVNGIIKANKGIWKGAVWYPFVYINKEDAILDPNYPNVILYCTNNISGKVYLPKITNNINGCVFNIYIVNIPTKTTPTLREVSSNELNILDFNNLDETNNFEPKKTFSYRGVGILQIECVERNWIIISKSEKNFLISDKDTVFEQI